MIYRPIYSPNFVTLSNLRIFERGSFVTNKLSQQGARGHGEQENQPSEKSWHAKAEKGKNVQNMAQNMLRTEYKTRCLEVFL